MDANEQASTAGTTEASRLGTEWTLNDDLWALQTLPDRDPLSSHELATEFAAQLRYFTESGDGLQAVDSLIEGFRGLGAEGVAALVGLLQEPSAVVVARAADSLEMFSGDCLSFTYCASLPLFQTLLERREPLDAGCAESLIYALAATGISEEALDQYGVETAVATILNRGRWKEYDCGTIEDLMTGEAEAVPGILRSREDDVYTTEARILATLGEEAVPYLLNYIDELAPRPSASAEDAALASSGERPEKTSRSSRRTLAERSAEALAYIPNSLNELAGLACHDEDPVFEVATASLGRHLEGFRAVSILVSQIERRPQRVLALSCALERILAEDSDEVEEIERERAITVLLETVPSIEEIETRETVNSALTYLGEDVLPMAVNLLSTHPSPLEQSRLLITIGTLLIQQYSLSPDDEPTLRSAVQNPDVMRLMIDPEVEAYLRERLGLEAKG